MGDTAAISLDQIRVASPCSMKWGAMSGDDRARHCAACDKTVYDLTNLTRAEAEALVFESEGRVCARFWRRADGTVITSDCPIGLGETRRRRARVLTAAAALLALGVGAIGSIVGHRRDAETLRGARVTLSDIEPFSTVRGWFVAPSVAPPPMPRMVMGDICVPAPTGAGGAGQPGSGG